MLPPRIRIDRPGKLKSVIRSQAHLRFVREHHCSVGCPGMPIEAAHVRIGTDGGTGMKPGDDWTISLCHAHHAEQHQIGEPAFERKYNLDMKALAAEFAAKSPALRRLK